MFRFLIALGLFWVAVPGVASVGLGAIEVRSFLNQPLDAEIGVDGSSVGDPALAIRVASEEDYRRVGLTRGAVPPDLVIVIEGAGDSGVVRLSTQRPVREPYIGLLLEASWTGGRTLREYTLLLDPPVAFSPARSAPPVLSATPPPDAVRAAPPAVAAVPADRPRTGAYRVNRGDTLFGIVRGIGYAGVTDQQVMLAILEANPNGFVGQNINQMRADVTLTLPTEAEVAQRNPVVARQEVRRQTETWRARLEPAEAPPPALALAPPETRTTTLLPEELPPETPAEVATPLEESPAASAPIAGVEPEIAIDEATTGLEGIDDPVTGVAEEPVVSEDLEGTDGVREDRLEILAESAAGLETTPTQAGTQILEEAMLSQQAAMDALREELVSLRTELTERDQLLSLVSTELAQLEERMQALPDQTPAAGAASFEDLPLHERILADPLLLIMTGTLFLLLLLLVLTLFRRPHEQEIIKRQPNGADTRVAADTVSGGVDPVERRQLRSAAAAGVTAGAGMASASEKGFQAWEQVAGADGQSGAGGDQSSESLAEGRMSEEDVLADVELYLAYGMNDQAISSLEHAINEGHDSLGYRVRLLEAHGANDDADTVRQQAEALRAELGPDDADWLSRIAAVEHMMFGTLGAATSQGSEGTATASTASDLSESDRASTSVPNGTLPETPPGPGVTKPDTPEFGRLEATPTTADVGFDQATDGTSDEHLLQFDLEELESPADSGKTSSEASAGGTDDGAADLPPLDLTAAGAPSAESGAQGSEQASPSTAEDASEVGMKLNLAEAFADMGDREGALALLNEVASAGTEAQAAKAEKIRSKLDLK